MPIQDAPIQDAIAAERIELAELLSDLTEQQWDAPSLCTGWRVREVVAHMTLAFRHGEHDYPLGALPSPGEVNRAADEWARRDAARLTPAELTSSLRENARHPWHPGGLLEGALTHDVVHGLDITLALGIDRRVPLDRLRMVLDTLVPDRYAFFGTELSDTELRAQDLDWRFGKGQPYRAPAQRLVLLLCGRLEPGTNRASGLVE
ncbi:maleylpyruvate isomerase family mycothiol-dependent enzyme [Sciscionella marina]|uniref:maleylpyruvate isomerase family mycothiol-dependent enzyme n=1 Tax=Sciscionella marina TaxID=508770 RepID=UPI00037F2730|nr:maleylpyruvate isomerase family mycothiol-dependent enzyme [Sciscionella marina]